MKKSLIAVAGAVLFSVSVQAQQALEFPESPWTSLQRTLQDPMSAKAIFWPDKSGRKTTFGGGSVIAVWNGQATAGGIVTSQDSTRYTYSGGRGSGIPWYSNSIPYDTLTSYYRDSAASVFVKNPYRSFKVWDQSSHLLAFYKEYWSGNSFYPISRYTYFYDADGNDTLIKFENFRNGVWELDAYNRREFRAGRMISNTNMIVKGIDGSFTPSARELYSYDFYGNIEVTTRETWDNSTNSFYPGSRYAMHYNRYNQPVLYTFENYYKSSGSWFLDEQYVYFYDNELRLSAVKREYNINSIWGPQRDSSVYSDFTSLGLPQLAIGYNPISFGSQIWVQATRTTMAYTGSGMLSTFVGEEYKGGNWQYTSRYFDFYNSFDQPIDHYEQNWDGSGWTGSPGIYEVESRYHYATNMAVKSQSAQAPSIIISPVPATDVLSVALYFPISAPVNYAAVVTDVAGKLIFSFNGTSKGHFTKDMSVKNWPEGIYHFVIQSDGGKTAKTFVVKH